MTAAVVSCLTTSAYCHLSAASVAPELTLTAANQAATAGSQAGASTPVRLQAFPDVGESPLQALFSRFLLSFYNVLKNLLVKAVGMIPLAGVRKGLF